MTAIQVATSFVTMVARTIYNFLLINFFEFRPTRNEAFSVSAQLRVAGNIKEHSLQCCDLNFLNENSWSHCTLSHWTEMSEENLFEKTKQKLDFHEFLNMTYLSIGFWIFSGNWIRMCPQLVPWESYLI